MFAAAFASAASNNRCKSVSEVWKETPVGVAASAAGGISSRALMRVASVRITSVLFIGEGSRRPNTHRGVCHRRTFPSPAVITDNHVVPTGVTDFGQRDVHLAHTWTPSLPNSKPRILPPKSAAKRLHTRFSSRRVWRKWGQPKCRSDRTNAHRGSLSCRRSSTRRRPPDRQKGSRPGNEQPSHHHLAAGMRRDRRLSTPLPASRLPRKSSGCSDRPNWRRRPCAIRRRHRRKGQRTPSTEAMSRPPVGLRIVA